MEKCQICSERIKNFQLCKNCWLALKLLNNNRGLVKRALQYLSGNLARPKLKRNAEIARLVKEQRKDANDRYMRFERAVTK